MKRFITALLLSNLMFVAKAQTKCNIQKTYAFFKSSFTGTIIKEDDKIIQPPAILDRFIYVETRASQKPIVDTVIYYDGKVYAAVAEKLKQRSVFVGMKKDSDKTINIIPKKGNIIWQLQLSERRQDQSLKSKTGAKSIILKGKTKSAKCTISSETELEPDIRG